ncbi:MAG: 30S ribosomal protein S2 [Planctomycetes bacterium]|nr:30S ribosomal protein S2 [Planctomycetota bacterium]
MSIVSVKELLDAGVQFGHPTSVWNPRMQPYIFGKRNGIHIIDLKGTVRGLIRAYNFLQRLCGDGHMVLFVGTKRQARSAVVAEARRCGQPYVAERWLGGMLTNFYTIRTRLKRLEELEALETQGAGAFSSKSEANRALREKRKIQKNLDGVRTMEKLPGAVIVIDPVIEHIAVAEAGKLGIPVVALLDTDCNPAPIDIPIPGNDDAMRAIQIVLARLADAVLRGNQDWKVREAILRKQEDDRRRVDEKRREEIRRRQRAEAEQRKRRDEAERKARESAARQAAIDAGEDVGPLEAEEPAEPPVVDEEPPAAAEE